MKIKRRSADTLLIEGDVGSILFSLTEVGPEIDGLVVIGPSSQNEFAKPGEYELGGITVMIAEQSDVMGGVGNLFKLVVDDVSLLFVTSDLPKIGKEISDFVGDVDVMFVTSTTTEKNYKSALAGFEFRQVSTIEDVSAEELEKLTGLKPAAEGATMKFSKSDMTGSDYAIQSFLVTKK